MVKEAKGGNYSGRGNEVASCCRVEALVSVDERGQMVIPKEIRNKANIKAGDKLAIASWVKNGKICCISMIKAEELTDMVKATLGPVMKDTIQE